MFNNGHFVNVNGHFVGNIQNGPVQVLQPVPYGHQPSHQPGHQPAPLQVLHQGNPAMLIPVYQMPGPDHRQYGTPAAPVAIPTTIGLGPVSTPPMTALMPSATLELGGVPLTSALPAPTTPPGSDTSQPRFEAVRVNVTTPCVHGMKCSDATSEHAESHTHPDGWLPVCIAGNKCGCIGRRHATMYAHPADWAPPQRQGRKKKSPTA